jgi:hypothetical protein
MRKWGRESGNAGRFDERRERKGAMDGVWGLGQGGYLFKYQTLKFDYNILNVYKRVCSYSEGAEACTKLRKSRIFENLLYYDVSYRFSTSLQF